MDKVVNSIRALHFVTITPIPSLSAAMVLEISAAGERRGNLV